MFNGISSRSWKWKDWVVGMWEKGNRAEKWLNTSGVVVASLNQ